MGIELWEGSFASGYDFGLLNYGTATTPGVLEYLLGSSSRLVSLRHMDPPIPTNSRFSINYTWVVLYCSTAFSFRISPAPLLFILFLSTFDLYPRFEHLLIGLLLSALKARFLDYNPKTTSFLFRRARPFMSGKVCDLHPSFCQFLITLAQSAIRDHGTSFTTDLEVLSFLRHDLPFTLLPLLGRTANQV